VDRINSAAKGECAVLIAIVGLFLATSSASPTVDASERQTWRASVVESLATKCVDSLPAGQVAVGYSPSKNPSEAFVSVRAYKTLLRNSKFASPMWIGFIYNTKANYWVYQSTTYDQTRIVSGAWAPQLSGLPQRIVYVASLLDKRHWAPLQVKLEDFDASGNQLVLIPCKQ
jgi:hypothetical protein